MKFKAFSFLLFSVGALSLSAQNIVQNGSFEELTKKPKNPGEIYLAEPWKGGTKAYPDIYSKSAKNDQIEVPMNAYGEQKPKDGENYAGILVYSNREAEPRSYLTQKLKYPMLAGEYYCVKFHICFADLSKYACNNIGAYVSHDSVGSETDLILNFKPQIINSTNRIFEKQWDWEDICRIYVAEGGEQYLTIGNFAPQEETRTISVKRPREFSTTQFRDGYYFVDQITVTPNATPQNCKCEPGNFAFANLEKEEASFETAKEDIPDQVIIGTTGTLPGDEEAEEGASTPENFNVQFAARSFKLEQSYADQLNGIAEYLEQNNEAKVVIIGHNDESEKSVKYLSDKRLGQVAKYLASKGVAESRIQKKNLMANKPLDSKPESNMVVEVMIQE